MEFRLNETLCGIHWAILIMADNLARQFPEEVVHLCRLLDFGLTSTSPRIFHLSGLNLAVLGWPIVPAAIIFAARS